MEKKIDIGQNAKVWIEWKVKPTDHSQEGERSIASLFASKYGIPINNIKVTTVLDTKNADGIYEGLNSTNAKNIQDPKFQLEMIKQYIKENGLDDCDFNEIVKIDSQVNSLIDYSVYEKSKRYQIKWVKWDNFLSYGSDNFFDFTKLNGLVLLNGEPANESGKSTFAYDLLHFLLFGKTNQDKAKTNEQLFNNYRKDVNEVLVEGCIRIDGEDYIIKRVLTRKGKTKITVSQKVNFYHVLPNGTNEELVDVENSSDENTSKTNKVIKEALGNEKDFDLIISANSKDLDELISMGDTDRGKLLTRWIGLSPIEDKEIKAKQIRKAELSKGRFCDLYDRTTLNNEITEHTNKIAEDKDAIKSETKRNSTALKELEKLNSDIIGMAQNKVAVDQDIMKLDLNTLNVQLNNIIEKGKKDKATYEELSKQIEELKSISFDKKAYDDLVKEKETLIEDISSIKSEIKQLNQTNELLSSQEFCPTCGRKFENIDNSGKIKENNEKITSLTNDGISKNKRKTDVEAEIGKMDTNRTQLEKRSKIELKAMAVNIDITDGRTQYKETYTLIEKLKQNEEAIVKNNKIDAEINIIKANVSTQENIIRQSEYNIATYNKDIETLESYINDKKSKIVAIDNELKAEKNWNIYLKAIGKDGISKMVLRHALPIINTELKNLLNDCADFDVEVSINDSNAVEFWLIRDNTRTRLSAASGLERTQASLALRVVLGKMSRLSCPPFILLDEVLGTVAASNYDVMKNLYDKIVPLYDFVLHITHLDAITDWHDMTLTVCKNDNISSVKPLILK